MTSLLSNLSLKSPITHLPRILNTGDASCCNRQRHVGLNGIHAKLVEQLREPAWFLSENLITNQKHVLKTLKLLYYSLLRVIPALTKILWYLSAMVLTYILTLFLAHLSGREEEERKILIKFRDFRARGQPVSKISSELSSPPVPPPPSCWGTAVPAEIWSSQLRPGSVHWNLELAVLSGISSDILSGILSGSIWHIFWHFSGILSCVSSDSLSDILSGISSDSFLALYLTYILTVFLAFTICGLVETPNPFKWFFHTLSFCFSSYRFSKCWLHTASHLDHRIHMREEREKEKE